MKKYKIYKYTSPSGGVYIGQTSRTISQRAQKNRQQYLLINKETGEFLQPSIANAIIKYGWDNFKKEILFDNLSSEEADIKEKELIAFYKADGKCYNIASGGKGVPGVCEHKVKQYTLNEEFIKEWDSIKDAEEYIGISQASSNISTCCLKTKHRAYGYIWRYAEDNSEIKPLTPYRVPIDQFTKDGDYISTYPTIVEASKQTGIGGTSIGNCLRNRSKSAGGYVWKFHNN